MKLNLLRSTLIFALILSGCTGRGGDSGNTTETDTDTDTDTDADADADTDTDTDADSGFTISGGTYYLAEKADGGEGLSVTIGDPTQALGGGDIITLGTSTTAADGSFSVGGLSTSLGADAPYGLFMLVTGTGVMTSATGIDNAEYLKLVDGDELASKTALVVSTTFQEGIDQSLTAAGYTGESITVMGGIILLVRDADGNAVEGAVVSGSTPGATFYYLDGDSSDGLFTSATNGLNTSTSVEGSAMVFFPGTTTTGATIDYYSADDGGAHDFAPRLAGSLPGLIAFAGIYEY